MAVTIFRDLQAAGHIPSSARLSDAPPSNPSGQVGSSYEARLVGLIRDRDSNGRLDIDVDQLRNSGMLTGSPTNDQIEQAISGAPRTQVSDAFLRGQTESHWPSRGSDLTSLHHPNARGREVQRYSNGMVLNGSQERQTQQFLGEVDARARQSPEESRRVADEAIAGAQLLTTRNDTRNARELLIGTGDRLQQAGRLDDAERVFRELQRPPHRDAQVNLVQPHVDAERRRSTSFDPARHVAQVDNNGTHTEITPTSATYNTTYNGLAERRLAQIQQTRDIQRVVPNGDPNNVDHMRQYFTNYSQNHTTEQTGQEYQRYLQNFYAHPGNNGVTWRSDIPPDQRPARVQEMFNGQPRDTSGRTIIDCEGYTYLTDRIFRDMPGQNGQPRFGVVHAGTPDHVIAGVVDRNTGEGFTVNNSDTRSFQARSAADVALAMGREIGRDNLTLIAMGDRPSRADAADDGTGQPHVGSIIWNGSNGPVGVVDEGFVTEWQQAQSNPQDYVRILGARPTGADVAGRRIREGTLPESL